LSPDGVRPETNNCPYCGSQMQAETNFCEGCGTICPRCGTPSKETPCPQCGHGSVSQRYSPTGSPAPAQSPELSEVRRIIGRTPSRREFYMVRGMVDRNRERIHRLAELLRERFPAPLSRELIEARALQVRNKASKAGSDLTHAECVTFAFLEAASRSGMLDRALTSLAEAQLLDANLKLGLSAARLPPLKFRVEVSGGSAEAEPVLFVDGAFTSSKVVLLDRRPHGRKYLLLWRPLLSDCLGVDGRQTRTVSAAIKAGPTYFPLRIAFEDAAGEPADRVEVVLDQRRFFRGFTTRKAVEVDAGIRGAPALESEGDVMLRRIGRQLDGLWTTALLFRVAGSGTPSGAIWPMARRMVAEPPISRLAVTPRRKAAAAVIAADIRHFSKLGRAAKTNLSFTVRRIPLGRRDSLYTCQLGLVVPSEFSAAVGVQWGDVLSLVKS